MKVFTKKHAVVGFVTLKALSRYLDRRQKRRREGRGARIAFFATLAVVTLGVLAAVAYFRRQSAADEQAVEDAAEAAETTAETVRDTVAEAASDVDGAITLEPAPAT